MQQGFLYLEGAFKLEEIPSSHYHLEAVIASLHAEASSFETTDWKTIYSLYEALEKRRPTPIVSLNKAIAAAYAISKEEALEQMLVIKDLHNYYLYHTSVGEMFFELKKFKEAETCFRKALALTPSKQEQKLLQLKLEKCMSTQTTK